jgi:hypothetical protein
VSDEVFTIGQDEGLRLDLEALVEVLHRESKAGLDANDLELAEAQLRDVLRASAMVKVPVQPRERRRIGKGRYLAVGALGRVGLSIVLGPVLHVVAAGSALSSVRQLLKVDRDWRPRVVAIYARLDGLDRNVFEAIHEAQNEWIITNYDAIAQRQYSQAFGQVAPTASDVVARLSANPSEARVRSVLANLVSRGILDTDGLRYWIRF